MENKKAIYCPNCNRKVGNHLLKSEIDTWCKCRKCNKRVTYKADTGEIKVTPLPDRISAGGVFFV